MNERERTRLTDRIDRTSGTVGAEIPATIPLDGETFELREFVVEVNRHDTVPSAVEERVEAVTRLLKRERLRLRQRIENDEVDFETGEELVERVIGIDRALNALESLDDPGLEEQFRQERIENAQDLLGFIEDVT